MVNLLINRLTNDLSDEKFSTGSFLIINLPHAGHKL